MTRCGKTFKDQKEAKALKHEREPRPHEKGGMRNLVREALEEISEEKPEEVEVEQPVSEV